jgi:hypothetical protein
MLFYVAWTTDDGKIGQLFAPEMIADVVCLKIVRRAAFLATAADGFDF